MKLDRFIKRPVLSTVLSILVVILGVLGLVSLHIEQYPNIAPPTIMVRAAYTGANSETVLNSVLAPLEDCDETNLAYKAWKALCPYNHRVL